MHAADFVGAIEIGKRTRHARWSLARWRAIETSPVSSGWRSESSACGPNSGIM
jgi:hypothetical protein